MKLYLTIFATCLCLIAAAQAENASRRRNFNLENFVAMKGFDPVSYFKDKPTKGNEKISYDHKGVIYYFVSTENREEFKKSPSKYEPAYGGWCAYTVALNGERVKISPFTYKMVDGRLYLFYNFNNDNRLDLWNADEKKLKAAAPKTGQKRCTESVMKNYSLPEGYSLLQSFLRTYKQVKDPIGSMVESMEKFDGTYAVNMGIQRLIVTQDPAFIEYVLKTNHKNYHKSPIQTEQLGRFLGKGLLTSNGEYWLKQRRLIQPGFHTDKIQALYSIIKKTVDDFLQSFPTGEQVDVYPRMNSLAFEIVINTLFTIKVPAETRNELSRFISETQDFVIKDIRQPHKSWWFKISGEVRKNLEKAEGARAIIRNIIRERKESNKKFNDLLDMLLDARYEDTGTPMSEEQVIDEILIIVIAGHETTANALSWTLYLLANHPEELKKLRQATAGISFTDCVSNDSLACVIKESMRLYPPAWISDRIALHDDHYNHYAFPKDTIVVLFYYGLHRDEKLWKNPLDFIPERFSKNSTDKERSKIYFPFGSGPRLCIGNNFAMAEMAIFLQAMIHRFDINPTGIIPQMKPLVTLRPDRVVLGIQKI